MRRRGCEFLTIKVWPTGSAPLCALMSARAWAKRHRGEAWAGYRAAEALSGAPTLWVSGEGNTDRDAIAGPALGIAWS